MQQYEILIDCEAKSVQVLALLSRIVRWWISSNLVWINGRRNDMPYQSETNYIEPSEETMQIPKIQFTIQIEVHEERANRTFLNAFTTPIYTVTPKIGVLANVHTGGINP